MNRVSIVSLVLGLAAMAMAASPADTDLVSLFREWRAFQKPPRRDGVPDYTAAAMAAQQRALASWPRRLAAMDSSGGPIAQQVDLHLVRAEMNGLDFDHRVLRPWANNPAFYVTVFTSESDQPAREVRRQIDSRQNQACAKARHELDERRERLRPSLHAFAQ